MKKYLLTSTAFTGEVEFTFNDLGMLGSFDASRADLSAKQQEWILKAMPDTFQSVAATTPPNTAEVKLTGVAGMKK